MYSVYYTKLQMLLYKLVQIVLHKTMLNYRQNHIYKQHTQTKQVAPLYCTMRSTQNFKAWYTELHCVLC